VCWKRGLHTVLRKTKVTKQSLVRAYHNTHNLNLYSKECTLCFKALRRPEKA